MSTAYVAIGSCIMKKYITRNIGQLYAAHFKSRRWSCLNWEDEIL
jgi:hypothetical protein